MKKEPTELQKLQWENKALKDALQYLVDTKKYKDTIGKDSIYMSRQRFGWMKAEQLLKNEDLTEEEVRENHKKHSYQPKDEN